MLQFDNNGVNQVLPMLASALEFGGAPAVALGALLQIGKSLTEEQFTEQVIPALSKLFASNDRTIRRSLLESIDLYGTHFSQVNPLWYLLHWYVLYKQVLEAHGSYAEKLCTPLFNGTYSLHAGCSGSTGVPSCSHRLHRQQCIPAGAHSQEHVDTCPQADTEDPQPVIAQIPCKAAGMEVNTNCVQFLGPLLDCAELHIVVQFFGSEKWQCR